MRDESDIYPENYHIIPSEMRTDEWWNRWWRQREQEKLNENKRRSKVESDWKDYWGSSDHLQQDVQELGEDKFTREILYYCESRGIASYLEAREQFERRVLETDEYYNGIINVRVGGSKILREGLKGK